MFFAAANTSRAWFAAGTIFCDADQDGVISSNDVPFPGILVLVTNVSGTFSNAAWSGADGFFIVQLPETNDSYVETLVPETLPPDSGILFPVPPLYSFSLDTNNQIFFGDWLINNPACQSGGCWMTGGGTFGTGKKPDHSFGGNVFPGCSSTAGQGGNWNDIAHKLKLHFQGTVITTVRCGNVVGIPPGSDSPESPFNFIEFEGTGTLKGIAGNQTNYGPVAFFARAEDRAEPGKGIDRYYLRVFTPDGTTQLLVSGDPLNPTNVVTVPISTGNFQIHPCQ